jgi:ribosome recycling factor
MNELVEILVEDVKDRMKKAAGHARTEFSSVRSGRAAPELIEKIVVEAYGVEMKIVELASVSVPEARQLLVTPHDAGNLDAIEKGIMHSDLGLTPSSDGRSLRLNFPPLTAERRKELVKLVKNMAEEGRVAIRNIRRDARKELESNEKDGELSSDELARAEKELDLMTHVYESEVDKALTDKEQELLEV